MSIPEPPTADDIREMIGLAGGYRISQSIHAVAELGIADLLKDGAKTAEELARAAGVHAESLYRILRLLAGVRVFTEVAPRQFALTRLGAVLQRDLAGTPRANVRNWLHESQWTPWGRLLHCLRTGEPAFDAVHGMGFFEYMQKHPDVAQVFNEAMTANTERDGLVIAAAYDFTGIDTLVDVGGGHGCLIASLLRANRAMRGILFDQPEVVMQAAPVLLKAGVLDRCRVTGGDFFEEVPAGASAYLLSHIIHDWDDAKAALILRNCRQAVAGGGRILVFERLVSADHVQGLGVLQIDAEMMVNLAGLERTEEQFRALFARAGLSLVGIRAICESGGHAIMEGVPA